MQVWRQRQGRRGAAAAELFVSAQTLKPSDHLTMQAAAQALIDSSISKTVNCPEDIGFDEFADIYVEGYHLGCKGLTTYRPNAVTGSVLSAVATSRSRRRCPKPRWRRAPRRCTARPTSSNGRKARTRSMSPSTTSTTDGERRPFEIFINSKNMEHYAWTLGLTRMISAVFRRGGDVSFVAEELKAVFDPRGGAWMQGRYVPSLLAAIGEVIERHIVEAAQ